MSVLVKPISWALALAATFALAGPAGAASGTQIDLNGNLFYPDMVPGNQSSIGASYHSGAVAGFGQSQALPLSAQGADGNGVSGTASFLATADAEIGTLHALAGGNASSTPAASGGPFPHATARADVTTSFWDTVTLFDPTKALGVPISVAISIQLDWQGVYGGSVGNASSIVQVSANFGMSALGNVGIQRTRNSDAPNNPVNQVDPPLVGTFANGVVMGVSGSLFVTVDTGVGGVTFASVSSYATSDASNTAHFFISGAPTLTAIGETGHNYAPSAVPEPPAALLLALGSVGLVLWRRRATQETLQ